MGFTERFQSLSGFFRPCNQGRSKAAVLQLKMFQSLSGFFRPCNAGSVRMSPAGNHSFNPCRVFSGLATVQRHRQPIGA